MSTEPIPPNSARTLTADTKYRILLQIAQRLRRTLDLDEILDHILDTLASIVAYDAAGVFVLAREHPNPAHAQRFLTIAGMSARGFDPPPVETDTMLRYGKGIIGHVISSGRPHVATDVRHDPYYVEGRRATRSEIAVPIVIDSRTIGALNLESDTLGAYSEADVDTLQFFADAAAISIDKAILHRQLLEKRRIESQLAIAHDVQLRLLPREAPRVDGYDIAAVSIPSFEIGGDYFDYVSLPSNRLGLVVADVSGKGIAAALIMATFRTALKIHARAEGEPDVVMQAVNRFLVESIGLPAFVTSVYGVLEADSGRFTYANCGHNPPMMLRASGAVGELEGGGPFLGVFDSAAYGAHESTLSPGDLLLLYTDGVVDVAGSDDVEFGAQRLAEVARASRHLGAAAVIDEAVRATRLHADIDTYQDDFTLLVVRRL